MPPRTLFTSDDHFGHEAALRARLGLNRPFATIEEHDEALIARWNAAVGPDDIVWHLGDFCYRCPEDRARAIFGRLNGRQRFLGQPGRQQGDSKKFAVVGHEFSSPRWESLELTTVGHVFWAGELHRVLRAVVKHRGFAGHVAAVDRGQGRIIGPAAYYEDGAY